MSSANSEPPADLAHRENAAERSDIPPRTRYVSAYTDLAHKVRAAGLLRRRYGYYWSMIIGLLTLFAGVWVVFAIVGNSWFQLVVAAVLGVVLAQFGYLGHDSAHRQVFASHKWNDWTARVVSGLFVGLGHGWWLSKHSRHHANPNKEGADPDVGPGVLAFTPTAVTARTGLAARLTQRQGYYFFPLLLLEGLNLHVATIKAMLNRRSKQRWWDASFVAVRFGGYVVVLLIALPPGKAMAFFGVQMAVFGLMLGGSFAPNHIGMPVVASDTKIDFLRRQVLMSRNISGGRVVDLALGGLNHQIEHHLFPNMPRPNLRRVKPIVRDYCAKHNIHYTESNLLTAFGAVVRYLNSAGRASYDTFRCPLATEYRG